VEEDAEGEEASGSDESVESARRLRAAQYKAWRQLAVVAGAWLAVLALVFQLSPLLGLVLLVLLGIMVTFIATERAWWHASASTEATFWALQAMVTLAAVLFIESPIALGLSYPLPSTVAVLFVGFLVRLYNRLLDMRNMTPLLPPRWDGSAPLAHWQAAKLLEADIQALLFRLHWWPRLRRNAFLARERGIVEQIRRLQNREQLNYVLRHVNLAQLLDVVKDHRFRRGSDGNLRTALMAQLCVERVDELELYSKAVLLNALLRFGLRAHARAQEWTLALLLSVRAADLTLLKNVMDNYSEFYSLHYLVYRGLLDGRLRERALEHLAREAVTVPRAGVKVVSDIDDTLASSGGAFPAGVDWRYPKHVIYPGVLAFYRELDLGALDPDAYSGRWADERLGNMVFLSARPHIYKDNSEEVRLVSSACLCRLSSCIAYRLGVLSQVPQAAAARRGSPR